MVDFDEKGYEFNWDDEELALTPDFEWACGYLDKWISFPNTSPSALFKGSLVAISAWNKKNNPDWLAQSANSLRDILYHFCYYKRKESIDSKGRKSIFKNIFKITQTESEAEEIADRLNKLLGLFSFIAHHSTSKSEFKKHKKILKKDFEIIISNTDQIADVYSDLIKIFVFLLKRSSENIIQVFKKIDLIVAVEPTETTKAELDLLLHSHINAHHYFLAHVPISWIEWLSKNGFFEGLNAEAEDKTRYSYRMPELSYLFRVVDSGGDEKKVIEIMDSVDCVKNFNPEVVDQFLWITQKLSAEGLVKVVPKIEKEKWVILMKDFKASGFSYAPQIKNLLEAKEYESILILAKAILVLNQDDRKDDDYFYQYFYLSDISSSGVFEALLSLEGEYIKQGMEFILSTFTMLTTKKDDRKGSFFSSAHSFYLSGLDLFDPPINPRRHGTNREGLQCLMSVLAGLIKKQAEDDPRAFYNNCIAKLPNSLWMWRIKLFFMSFYPNIFSEDLKDELNLPFKAEDYYSFLSDTEYYQIIKLVFPGWSDGEAGEKRIYVNKILAYFSKESKDARENKWKKECGWAILSSIEKELTSDEKIECKKHFDKLPDPDFNVSVPTNDVQGGTVRDISPVKMANYKDIADLIKDLKGKLSPENLKDKYKDDDLLKPRNTEGVGNELKENMQTRISDYLIHAEDFLATDMHIHYTYSFLRGVEDYLRSKKRLNKEAWDNLFALFNKIKISEKRSSKKEDGKWLASWNSIEKVIADILLFFLAKEYSEFFADKRDDAFELIKHFLQSEDPKPEDETSEYGSLFSIAINSVRGRALQDLVHFIYLDGEGLKQDVLNLYADTIDKASPSVRFIIGRHLSSFYSRDKNEVRKLFEKIFPKSEGQNTDFIAAWDGYLSATIYKELFEDLNGYYQFALNLDPEIYSHEKKYEDIDQKIATHLALGFAHFENVEFTKENKHPLLEKLWAGSNVKRQKEFISFLGRGIISHSNAGDVWFEESKVNLQEFKDLWAFLLNEEGLDKEVYSAFGFWINHEKDIFDYSWLAEMMAETLTKSNGIINWDHGLSTRLLKFAEANPKKTLVILEKYILEGILGESNDKNWFYLDDNKIAAFELLYKAEPLTTKSLINKLLKKGRKTFWKLNDIITD